MKRFHLLAATHGAAFAVGFALGVCFLPILTAPAAPAAADFNRLKPKMARVGDVKTFENFIVPVPAGIDPNAYDTVIAWCESFGQFITAARYR